jgi:hypothetical protein
MHFLEHVYIIPALYIYYRLVTKFENIKHNDPGEPDDRVVVLFLIPRIVTAYVDSLCNEII